MASLSTPDGSSERLPIDVLPCSNGEFIPAPPTPRQRLIAAVADREAESLRARFRLSRRDFVRTAAATAVGLWAIDLVGPTRFGRFTAGVSARPSTDGRETLHNLPGEFVFDVQTHHVEPDQLWRATNPEFHAFCTQLPQAREGGSADPIENLSRYHYAKEVFVDSATTMAVLSAVPGAPDSRQPLPFDGALSTVRRVNGLAGGELRCVLHGFVMPNLGSAGRYSAGTVAPALRDEEFARMRERAATHSDVLRGWKLYPAWGDVPRASGYYLDDQEMGLPMLEQVSAVAADHGVPAVVAVHKGFALPSFDLGAASLRDVGPAARQNPGVHFLIYHSGFEQGDVQGPYPGDAMVSSSLRRVDALIKSLRENEWDASRHGGNSPNVYAELGSVWRAVMHSPDQCAHLLGKLITHVGPKRICWGTDSLWYGSPHPEIVALRRFEFTSEGRALYGLPYGLEGDVEDPQRPAPTPARSIRNAILGRNGAAVYGIDPDAARARVEADDLARMRDEFILDRGLPTERAPLASNRVIGPRTRRQFLRMGLDR